MRRSTLLVVLALLAPIGGSIRPSAANSSVINHVVVVMQENRSFDNYFGQLAQAYPGMDVDGLTGNETNPDPLNPGQTIPVHHAQKTCEVADLNHSRSGSLAEYHNGANDGFTAANKNAEFDPSGSRTMGYFTQQEIPYYYSLAHTFALGDRYFASILSQTFPNRFFLLAGTAFGHFANDFPTSDPTSGFTQKSVFENLDAKGVTWKVYYAQIAFALEFGYVRKHVAEHIFPISQYYADAAAGTLPQVAYVDPIFVASNNTETDEHPTSNIQVGEQFGASVVDAFMHSPNWNDGALFYTYDEHGGFYDHVPPPATVAPDTITLGANKDADLTTFGFRVPSIVISPFAKRSYVSHQVNDHTSILRFIEDRFGLGTLTARDAASNAMSDFFDYAHPNTSVPALDAPVIDPQHFVECQLLDANRRSVDV